MLSQGSRRRRFGRPAAGRPARNAARAMLLLAALLVPAAASAQAELAVSLGDSLVLSQGRVTGLTWAGGDTLALLISLPDTFRADRAPRVVLQVGDARGEVYWQHDVTGTLSRGLAWDGSNLWSSGDDAEGGALLYKLERDGFVIVSTHTAPGHRPTGFAFDGRWLWVADRDQARLHRIDPQTGDVTRSVAAAGFSPTGLAWDGQAMWSTDTGTGRLTRLRGARLERREVVAADDWFRRGVDVLLAHDGRHLWCVAAGESVLRRIFLH